MTEFNDFGYPIAEGGGLVVSLEEFIMLKHWTESDIPDHTHRTLEAWGIPDAKERCKACQLELPDDSQGIVPVRPCICISNGTQSTCDCICHTEEIKNADIPD